MAPAAVTLLRPGLREDARPHPRVRCSGSVERCASRAPHPPGPGGGLRSRGALFCCALWCVAATRAMRTVCCSCRHHERSRRSRRRRATPPQEGRPLDSSIRSRHTKRKRVHKPVRALWWWWWFGRAVTEVSLSIPLHACNLIQVAERPGVRPPAAKSALRRTRQKCR